MKYIGYLFALTIIVCLTIQKHDQYPNSALMKAVIYDLEGEEVWNSASFGHRCINIVKGVPQITIGEEFPLFESYLDEIKADRLSIWLDYGSGYKHYVDYEMNKLVLNSMSKHSSQEELGNRKKRIKQLQKKDGDEATGGIEHMLWRQKQKGGKFDMQKMAAARRTIKENIEKVKRGNKNYLRDAGVAHWNSMGPNNIGGRVRAIAIHPSDPNIIFIGSVGGGIWETRDGGASWENSDDFMASLAVTSIVIDFSNPNIMYASTGESLGTQIGLPGLGILKSEDGGDTWSVLPFLQSIEWTNKIVMHPTNPSILYAAVTDGNKFIPGSSGKLYRTQNGGDTWLLVLSNTEPITDVDISSENPDLITASGINTFWRSTNGGTTFIEEIGQANGLPSGVNRIEIDMHSSDVNYLYALVHKDSTSASDNDRCRIYFSDDAGATWDPRFSDIDQVFRNNGFGNWSNTIWVDPFNFKYILFGGVDLWKSEDEGMTATRISDWKYYHTQTVPDSFSLHADQHIIVDALGYGNTNSSIYIGNDGGVQKANNIKIVSEYSGWENLVNNTLGITQFYSGAVSRAGDIFGGGAQDNAFSTGTNPTNWFQPITGDGGFMAIHPINSDTIYANTNYNRLWMSTDKGNTWTSEFPPVNFEIDLRQLGDTGSLIAPFIMDPDVPSTLYMGGKKLWKVVASTLDINEIKGPTSANANVSSISAANNGQTLWVGYDNGTLQNSTNGGISWSIDANPAPSFYNSFFITDIDISPDESQVIVTIAGYHGGGTDNNNLWKYDANGDSWKNISMDVDLQINCVTHHPSISNWIYVGTDIGIFASEDNGATWSTTPLYGPAGSEYGSEGPIYTEVTDLFWSGFAGVAPGSKLWASTFGRGLWRSNWVLDKIYVDRVNGSDGNTGTWLYPFKTFKKAVENAGSGANIVFVQGSNHEEIGNILLNKRVQIELNNGPVIIQ